MMVLLVGGLSSVSTATPVAPAHSVGQTVTPTGRAATESLVSTTTQLVAMDLLVGNAMVS